MATLSMEHVETECPICHENYVDPKILPCAHLLCRNCLVRWVKTSTEANCPLCRSAIFDLKDSNSRSSEDLADSLPTDHAMSAIVDSYKIISQRQVCCLHTNTDAVSLCLQCSVMMCQPCVEYHHAFPVTSSHKTENITTLTSERLAAFQQMPCSAHPTETIKLFCLNHNVSICHLCATSKHRACQEVTDLNEMLGKHKQLLAAMEDSLTKAESALNETLAKFEEMVEKMEKDTKDSFSKIDSMCDDLIVSVETCRNQLKKMLKESQEGFTTAIQDRKLYVERRVGFVTSHKLLLKRIQQTAFSSIQVGMVNVIQDRIRNLTSVVSPPSDMKPMKIVYFDEATLRRVKEELENISHMAVISLIRDPLQNTWLFHDKCGRNILLTNNGQTAEVKNNEDKCNRMVMSSEPMYTNSLYEVLVEETNTQYNRNFITLGVCEENPLSISVTSYCSEMKSFVGVCAVHSTRHLLTTKEYSCPALKTVKGGSHLGVMVDKSRSLHVYVDGKDQGVMAKNVARPCYAVFDIYVLKKVTTLPVLTIQ